jgi:cytochrome c oxidase cbb3-type subunit I/II
MKHEVIEKRAGLMGALIALVISVGGLVEIVPLYFSTQVATAAPGVKPYDALALEGRDIYIREGCVGCHSQMIRPLRAETERYGDYSKPGEFVFDHPFLWGSKRTGPDLQRVGGKYPDSWHFVHMKQPTATSPGSIMPGYPWLYTDTLDTSHTEGKIITLRRLGVPYPEGYERQAETDLKAQASHIAAGLSTGGLAAEPDREIVAVIAYLQRLGTDIKAAPAAAAAGGR